jgi:hypothetical protein
MQLKPLILFSGFLILVGYHTYAQSKYSPIVIDKQIKDTFSFAKKWDYSWEVFKDERTGKFTKNNSEPLKRSDTAHLFFTANCSTNVQGGYNIRYCFAYKKNEIITLIFSDGLPAYASEFFIYIKGDSCSFKPKIIYPGYIPGQKISYEVTKQNLTLNKSAYKTGDIIIGYVDTEFTEIVSVPKEETKSHKYYLRGYVRTPLKGPGK